MGFTNPVLVKFRHDVGDEFDAIGFAIEEKADIEAHIALCRETGKVPYGPSFGNLGAPRYPAVENYIYSLTIVPLTPEEAATLERLFGTLYFGKTPDFVRDEEELYDPGDDRW